MSFRVYPKQERRNIRKRIKELDLDDVSFAEMLPILEAEGFKRPSGGPLTVALIGQQGRAAGIRKRKKRRKLRKLAANGGESDVIPQFRDREPRDDDSVTLADLILDAQLSDAKKIAMLKGLRS